MGKISGFQILLARLHSPYAELYNLAHARITNEYIFHLAPSALAPV
jgi:hypothetical protein